MAKSTLKAALLAAGFAAVTLASGPLHAQSAVRVTFVQPDAYTDANDNRSRGEAATLKALQSYLETLGARYLKPGQTLDVSILDVDLAGRFEPWRTYAYDVRVMTGITWPTIKLRYALVEGGQPLRQAEETITDLNYQMRVDAGLSTESLRYEKAMLDDWFKARFAPTLPSAS